MVKYGQQRILLLISIMAVVAITVTATSLTLLYNQAFEQTRIRLIETVNTQAHMMESVARFDKKYSQEDVVGGARVATINQIIDAFEDVERISRTFEFTLAQRQDDQIVFLIPQASQNLPPLFVSIESKLAQPMRIALSGESGSVIAPDYLGRTVLAAFKPVKELELGIVAKVELAEIRAPFIKAGAIASVIAFTLILIGSFLFKRIGNPMIRRLERSELELLALNEGLEERIKERTSELNEKDLRLSFLIDSSPAVIYSSKISGNYDATYISEYVRKQLGYEPSQFLDDPNFWVSHIHPEDRDRVLSELSQVFEHGHYSHEYRFRHKDGSYLWMRDEARLVCDENGDAQEVLGYWVDISERKMAEQSVQAALQENRKLMRQLMQVQEDERRQLARDLHDELGQLLTSIDMRAEYIARHAGDTELRGMGELIVRSTRASFEASHDTLLKLRPATLDALGLADALSELADQWNSHKGIVCTLQINGEINQLDDLCSIAIYRLVQEGLSNAYRHGQATTVDVILRHIPPHENKAGWVRVEIRDNGKGLHGQDASKGMGIIGMRERVHALDGTFLLTQMPSSDGVLIEAIIPLENME